MPTSYPGSLDSLTTSISATDEMDNAGLEHDLLHNTAHGAINAVEAKVGTGASTPVANSVLAGTGSGTSAWATSPTLAGDLTVNGNVGIGTASPGEMLHVVTASGSSYLKQENGTATTYLGPDSANTGLFGTSSAHDVRFITTNTERMRILAGGNVGIGTASPAYLLDVQGSSDPKIRVKATGTGDSDAEIILDAADSGESVLRFYQDGTEKASIEYFDDGNPDLNIRTLAGTNGVIDFQPNNSLAMRIDENGLVGIGQSSLVATLGVEASADPWMHIVDTGTGTQSFGVDATAAYIASDIKPIHFKQGVTWNAHPGDSGSTVMAITTAGNVGIGTTSPAGRLHISDSTPTFQLTNTTAFGTSGGTDTLADIDFEGQKNGLYRTTARIRARQDGTWSAASANDANTALEFYTNGDAGKVLALTMTGTNEPQIKLNDSSVYNLYSNSSNLFLNAASGSAIYNRINNSTTMNINATGVAIGTGDSGANAKLTVKGTAYNTTLNVQADGAGKSYGIQFQDSGGTNYAFVGSPNNDDLHLWAQGASSYMYMQAGGAYRVYMHNGGDWLPYDDNTYDLGSSSKRWDDVYATNGTIQTSDVSLKSDVVDTPLGLGFIQALRPIQYRWNSGVRNHQGFIAQEVETVLDATSGVAASQTALWGNAAALSDTEFLPVEDENGIPRPVEVPIEPLQSLRYTEFIAPLVKAVQELAGRLESLEATVAA